MSLIPLVICERTGVWAAAARQLAERSFGESIAIAETRSPAECRDRLNERRTTSAGLPLLIEFSREIAIDVCELLSWHVRRFGDAPRGVVGSRGIAYYEQIIREAGATFFTTSIRDLQIVLASYMRYRDDPLHAPHDDERNMIERIRASLPWRPLREKNETA